MKSAATAPADSPGWCAVKTEPALATFLAEKPKAQLTVALTANVGVRLSLGDQIVDRVTREHWKCYCSSPVRCAKR